MKLVGRLLLAIAATLGVTKFAVAETSYLLFDDDDGLHGCVNCNSFSSQSICNEFGKFGSEFSSDSIWNDFGRVGSEFSTSSPWNDFGKGLKVVDGTGRYYGRLTMNIGVPDRIDAFDPWFKAYKALKKPESVRKLICDGT
ncbi:hypothetical protein CO665_34650 [Rhizobium anhuiense]|uniref:hypothetical protein n=1 Tax=Rhizobium anhuiense TaxID=1184720 RepID=UPI000BEA429B|nr:hypothetical protein [Rhizobium anhuiense]PDS33725.1 hypothetical protein CO665_34650 [Rhizobium anhuiense]